MIHPDQLPKPESEYDENWDLRFAGEPFREDLEMAFPKLSIVTPSFNQGRFIERTIRCILLQGYPNLEYIIIDGGSSDETRRIIEKYDPWISHWVSEPDTGMYDAINKGFAHSTGEIMAWSPTGDLYEPGALRMVGGVFQQFEEINWLTSLFKVRCDEDGRETARYRVDGFNRRAFRKGLHMPNGNPYSRYTIQQQSTFWRRSLWEACGGKMDDSMKGAGDYELWSRFITNSPVYCLDQPIGVFMTHDGQESVENAERMKAEYQVTMTRQRWKHISKAEGLLRSRILNRRPFLWGRRIPGVSFCAKVVCWNQECMTASLEQKYFVT